LYFKTVYVNIKILLEYVYIYEYITVLYSKDRHLILAFKYNDALGFFVPISPSKIAKIIFQTGFPNKLKIQSQSSH